VAIAAGFPVEQVTSEYCEIVYPFTWEGLAAAYDASPIRAMAALGKILCVIRAPSMTLQEELSGRDLGSVGLWYEAYKSYAPLGGHIGFMRVYGGSAEALSTFLARSRVQACLAKLAEVIERSSPLSKHAWMTALEVTGASALAPPDFQTILPPAVPRGVAPVRRSSTPATGQWRTANTGGMSLKLFARDARGQIRPFTESEWRFVKAQGFAAIARAFTKSELETVIANMERDITRQEGR
jgi:hypothetical protein